MTATPAAKEADMMDEKKMPLHSCLSLVDQLLRIPVKQRLHDVGLQVCDKVEPNAKSAFSLRFYSKSDTG